MRWIGYQLAWLRDPSPRKVYVKSRRIGISEVVSFEVACAAIGIDLISDPPRSVPPVPQNIVSAGQDLSKEFLARVIRHVKVLQKVTGAKLIAEESKTLVKLTNGTPLRAFSSNPNTIRSYEGDFTWDECAATPRAAEVWAAAKPLTDATLGQPAGYKIRVIGTPEGDDNMFHEFCRGDMSAHWSVHQTTIHDAVKDGFPADVQRLRDETGDPDIFAQEYECQFLAASMRYISAETYDRALYYAPEDIPGGYGMWYAGMDVARKRHNSAIVRAQKRGDTLWHMGTETRREETWDEQEAWVGTVMDQCSRLCVDSTGIGSQFSERLAARYPGRVEGVDFTLKSKEELATGMKLALERGRFRPMADDHDLRRDVLNLRRQVTNMGNVRYDAPEDRRGHADRAWAAALCVAASGGAVTHVTAPSVENMPSSTRERLGWGDRAGRPRPKLFG